MRKSKLFMNVTTLFAVLVSVVFISCGALFGDGQGGNVTINLPPISSSARAISSDKISDLKNATTSYRVTANGITREGAGGTFMFTLPVGAVAEITVECLNSSGNVIVRAKKTHTVTAGVNNVDINLSRDGDVVGTGGSNPPSGGNTPPAPPAPVQGQVTYNGNGAGSGTPSDTQNYDVGNEVTLQTGEPTRAGYTFAGWTSNVALEATDVSGGNVQITQSTAFVSTSSTAQSVTTKITSFKMPEGGVVLTAKWTPITYTIKFNNGGGTDNQNDLQFTVESTNITLPAATTFTPPQGKVFDHWATQADGDDAVTLSDIISGIKNGNASSYVRGNNEVEIFAVWDDAVRTVLYSDGKLIINELHENKRNTTVTKKYDAMQDDGSNYVFTFADSAPTTPWNAEANLITSVEIGSNIRPMNTSYWFTQLSNCTSIDLSNLDTSQVTTMLDMFSGCSKLTNLDLSNLNTSNLTTMTHMFTGCTALTNLNFGNSFDTSEVEYMNDMFTGCSMASLDLSSFDTSKVTSFSYMFDGCSNLQTIYVSTAFVVNGGADTTYMFYECSKLVGGAGTACDGEIFIDGAYARIDQGSDGLDGIGKSGYFTDIADKP